MTRAKRSSITLEMARQRLAGLKSINPAPDFGMDLTLPAYEELITRTANLLAAYNGDVAALDEKQVALHATEKQLREMNHRMLSVAELRYGRDSAEFEQAGGKRLSERKQKLRKARTPSPPAQ